jgi:hypothetical protein
VLKYRVVEVSVPDQRERVAHNLGVILLITRKFNTLALNHTVYVGSESMVCVCVCLCVYV